MKVCSSEHHYLTDHYMNATRMTTRAPVVTASMYITSVDVCTVARRRQRKLTDFAKFDVVLFASTDTVMRPMVVVKRADVCLLFCHF